MRSFVKAGIAAQDEETKKAKAREVAAKTGFRGTVNVAEHAKASHGRG